MLKKIKAAQNIFHPLRAEHFRKGIDRFCESISATSIYRLHFLSTSRVLLYRDTIDRVLFYIEMTVMMSDYPHKVLKLVCQAMVEIFANFVA